MTIAFYAPAEIPGRKYGITIDSISANGTTLGTATVISAPTAYTIVAVAVTSSPANHAVALPPGAEIGDVVEVYGLPSAGGIFIFSPLGESFTDGTSVISVASSGIAAVVRKIGSSTWGIVSVFA